MSEETPHRRRPRYSGKYPRRFDQKYKELSRNPDTLARVLASGKTPAGTHVPIMVEEILEVLDPRSGEIAVDCTLGFGGHTRRLLGRVAPGGHVLGLDADPVELPKTEAALRAEGFGAEVFTARKSNFAGLPAALVASGLSAADVILADLGVSSMQLDNPARGFTWKSAGPLDMRMNPSRGVSAAQWLSKTTPAALEVALIENADEPDAAALASALAGKNLETTTDLANAIRSALQNRSAELVEKSIRRVFQTVRIAVNEEFSALDALLRALPSCLNPGGRVAILTFHSGEDRRVKKAFQSFFREGVFQDISHDVTRASSQECHANPRATSAKLRWARRA
ncbi:MAG: 16S rRNA (cytosine(1402)-N(4))-methyltransferase RsmH [Spartobacteria bacterium]